MKTTVDTVEELSPKAFMELVAKLQPFFAQRKTGGGGDGIKFNEANEELPTRWLEITTNDSNPDTDQGQVYTDHSDAGVAWNVDATFEVNAFNVGLDALGMVHLQGGAGPIVETDSTETRVRLFTGMSLVVRNNTAAVIFRIDETGTVHILAGTTIVADL